MISERKKNIYIIWVDFGAAEDEPESEVVVDEFSAVGSEALEDGDRFGMIVPMGSGTRHHQVLGARVET